MLLHNHAIHPKTMQSTPWNCYHGPFGGILPATLKLKDMKKVLTLVVMGLLHFAYASAQDFIPAMESNLQSLDTASGQSYLALAHSFERIGRAEGKQWEPFYHAAYCYTMMASGTPDKSQKDLLADKAESYLDQAAALSANNSEINALHAMVLFIRVSVDPMGRWQTVGQEAYLYLDKAKEQDTSNPRPYYIESRMLVRLPEGLGGGREAALASVHISLQKYATFTPANTIAPKWGKQSAERFQQELSGKVANK